MRVLKVSAAFFSAIIFSMILSADNALMEKDFPNLTGKYFGQKEPGAQAELFSSGIISQEGRYEFALSFSPEGDELFFTGQVPENSIYVYYAKQEAGKWTKPEPVSLSQGAKKAEMEAFFSWDGRSIYFAPYDEGMDVRIWVADIRNEGWLNPREVGEPVSSDPAFYPTCSKNGVLFYTNLAERKIFTAHFKDGAVTRADEAGIEFGGHAFIAPDESFVLVDSRQDSGYGKADIYVAFRNPDKSWTKPVNLGDQVNTEYSETCPSVSADGKYLFFSRYNEPNEISNIYWISSKVIEDARND